MPRARIATLTVDDLRLVDVTGLRDLRFLEGMPKLRTLVVGCSDLTSLDGIAGNESLCYVTLSRLDRVATLEPLATLPRMVRLTLHASSGMPSLAPLAHLSPERMVVVPGAARAGGIHGGVLRISGPESIRSADPGCLFLRLL